MNTEAKYEVRPVFNKIDADSIIRVKVPGSKSITNRALLIAALAEGESRLKGALFSNDAKNMVSCLKSLGIEIETDEAKEEIVVRGCGGKLPVREADINVGSAGTAARFITALLAFSGGIYRVDALEQMKKRPMKPLFDALTELGAEISYQEKEGHFPVILNAKKIKGGRIRLDTAISSQFLSAVIMAGFLLKGGIEVELGNGRKKLPYVDMTVKVMESFGGRVTKTDEGVLAYKISENDGYKGREYDIEPDVSAACYFYAMAQILGCRVQVERIKFDSMQGDIEFVKLLTNIGATAVEEPGGIVVKGAENGIYNGIEADLNSFSDQSLTLAALSVFAKTPTRITGISHIRLQESDRLLAMETELNRLGIRTETGEGEITIFPEKEPGRGRVEIETYEDHRVAMAFALVGLKRAGIVIKNPGCSAKTFEKYFEILDGIYSKISEGN